MPLDGMRTGCTSVKHRQAAGLFRVQMFFPVLRHGHRKRAFLDVFKTKPHPFVRKATKLTKK